MEHDGQESLNPYHYGLNNPILMIDPTGMMATYNWDTGQYEDDGKEVTWSQVQSQYGLSSGNSDLNVHVLNEDSNLSSGDLFSVVNKASDIFKSNDIDFVSYNIVSSKTEFDNLNLGGGSDLGFSFRKGGFSPLGITKFKDIKWNSIQDVSGSFINTRAGDHINSDGSFDLDALAYTLAHESLHGFLAKSFGASGKSNNFILDSDDYAGHYNSFPNLMSGGTSKYGGISAYILAEHRARISIYHKRMQLKEIRP